MSQPVTQPQPQVVTPPLTAEVKPPTPEEARREKVGQAFARLVAAAQQLAYEKATLEYKPTYTFEELKPLFKAIDNVIKRVKELHTLLAPEE
jgi:hypothetical protein